MKGVNIFISQNHCIMTLCLIRARIPNLPSCRAPLGSRDKWKCMLNGKSMQNARDLGEEVSTRAHRYPNWKVSRCDDPAPNAITWLGGGKKKTMQRLAVYAGTNKC